MLTDEELEKLEREFTEKELEMQELWDRVKDKRKETLEVFAKLIGALKERDRAGQ